MKGNVVAGQNMPPVFIRHRISRSSPALDGLNYVYTGSDAQHLNISQMDTNAAAKNNAFSGGPGADAVVRTLGDLVFNGTTFQRGDSHAGDYSDHANGSTGSGFIRYQVKEPDFELTVSIDGSSSNNNNNNTPWMFVPSTYERGFMTSAHVGIFLCAVGIFFNLLLFVLLCSSRRLRFHYLYSQIMSISLADLGFVTMVDSFTVYFELQPWRLGADFCKTWMILDVALPSVALLALLLLNVDRVLFTYKTDYYNTLMQNTSAHVLVILSPWCVSCVVVCSLWLGFPAVQPQPGVCMYGITKEANAASSWLTVFLPSVLILILLIFVFIAVIGEMPSTNQFNPVQLNLNGRCANNAPGTDACCQSNDSSRSGLDRTRSAANTSITSVSHARRQRRFVAALLAVDFVSLAITLPYSAYSLVSPDCDDSQSCDSLRTLYQTLSWTRSSVACVRPILFILLTDLYQSFKRRMINWYVGELETSSSFAAYEQTRRDIRAPCVMARNDFINLTQGSRRHSCSIRSINNSTTASTALTPPQSPFQFQTIEQTPPRTKTSACGIGFTSLFKDESEGTFV
ncbi:unnamed protein product [Lymnaea stagnalis]|uniref:G-protein coupled receptors family 1 profile domain-containing protein n=1 Tax=Lymnaea stagnalis TaxID=6523 RepID=A0AAV2HXF0_LYMST